jgi:transposase
MDYFAGLDVSVKETSVCIVDDAGKIVREVRVASEPEALLQVLTNTIYRFKRVGLEAGPLSQWLYSVLAEAGLPVICVETRHMRAMLKAQINKTDRNDARGIAQMMRVGLYRPVHVKTLRSQKLRMLLTHRKLLQSKAIAIENDLRATLRNFGLKVGMIGTVKFEARIKELVENVPDLAVLVEPLLIVRQVIREQLGILHRRLLAIVRDDDVCRRLMTIPGATSFRLFGFELQGRCSAFTSWPARKRDPKTFSLAAHNQELVLRHMTFGLQQLFQISLERGLCFNHGIERLLHLGRQIICIDVLPLQFFPCHCLAPAWSDEKGIRYSS